MEGSTTLASSQPLAVVEQHKENVVTTLFIPIFDIERFPFYPEIMYKTDLKDILKPLRAKRPVADLSAEGHDQEINAMDVDPLQDKFGDLERRRPRAGDKRSSNIIDLLEKKYCGGHGMLDPGFEENSQVGWDESPILSQGGEDLDGKKTKKRKKGNKEQQADYYDMDDSFIDDSENITEIQAQISGKYLKTKHSGFFINAGDLEVLEGSDAQAYGKFAAKSSKSKTVEPAQKGVAAGTITPFHVFSKAKKESVRAENPEACIAQGGLNKLLGALWKGLDTTQRDIYVTAAAEAMKAKASEQKSTKSKSSNSELKSSKNKSNKSKTVEPAQKGVAAGTITPFHVFSKAKKESVRAENPEACIAKGGLNKLLGALWKGLDTTQRDIYVTAAAEAMKAKASEQKSSTPLKDPLKKVTDSNNNGILKPFQLYSKAKRTSTRELNPVVCMEPGGMNKLLGAMWKNLSDSEREIWSEMATAGNTIASKLISACASSFECYCQVKHPSLTSITAPQDETATRLWSALSEKEKAEWDIEADKKNSDRMEQFAATFCGLELFQAAKYSKENDADVAKAAWEEISAKKSLWEEAASAVRMHITSQLAKSTKRKRDDTKNQALSSKTVAVKKMKKVKNTEDDIHLIDSSCAGKEGVDTEKKKKKKKVNSDKETDQNNVTVDERERGGNSWSKPPSLIAAALTALRDTVAVELQVQNEQKKSKKSKAKNAGGEEVPVVLTLKKITPAVENQLHSLDTLSVQLNMPGVEPLMKVTKASTKPSVANDIIGDTSKCGDSTTDTANSDKTISLNSEPKYFEVLGTILNAPGGSSISPHQIRTSLLKHRCGQLIKTLFIKIEAEIPVIATSIKGKIELNEKYNVPIVTTELNEERLVENESTSEANPSEDMGQKQKEGEDSSLKYICKWDRDLRRQLFEVMDLVAQWVDAENDYREKYISALEKKSLEQEKVDYLHIVQQSTIVYNRIISLAFLPPSDSANCEKSDISFMRKVVSSEKQRFKKSVA